MLTFNDYLFATVTKYENLKGKKIYSRQCQDEIQMTNMHLKKLSGISGIKECYCHDNIMFTSKIDFKTFFKKINI